MGSTKRQRPGALPTPPPSPEQIKTRLALRDRFGLPVYPPSMFILGESTAEGRARVAKVEELVADVWNTAVANLGRRNARLLFQGVIKKRSVGRRMNQRRKREALKMWDEEAAKTPENTKSIATRLGRKLHPHDPMRAESEARYIQQAVSERARGRKAAEDRARLFGPSLLDAPETDG